MTGIAIALIAGLALTMWRAFALNLMWAWFAAPLVHLPTPAWPVFAGLLVMVEMVTTSSNSENKADPVERFAFAFALPLVGLLFGWVMKLFI